MDKEMLWRKKEEYNHFLYQNIPSHFNKYSSVQTLRAHEYFTLLQNIHSIWILANVRSALVSAIFDENKYFYKEYYCFFTGFYLLQETIKILTLQILKYEKRLVCVFIKYFHEIVHLHWVAALK